MKDTEVEHLSWMYARLIHLHNENENVDYMIKFKSIIDSYRPTLKKGQKAIYRIYNVDTQKYVSVGYKHKSSWHSLGWTKTAVKTYKKDYGWKSSMKLEIHAFPLGELIKININEN
jgi:hypothetical protein